MGFEWQIYRKFRVLDPVGAMILVYGYVPSGYPGLGYSSTYCITREYLDPDLDPYRNKIDFLKY